MQATDGHERLFTDPTQSLQVWRVRRFYQILRDIYTEFRCNCQWELGDLMDDRSSIPVPALDAVFEGLGNMPQSDLNFKLIGNHEQFLRNTKIHCGRMFEPYFRVIAQPESFMLNDRVRLVCAPYPADENELAAWLKEQSAGNDYTIMLGHFQISGCWGGSGQMLSGIPLDVLQRYDLGLLGHIHRHQQLGNCYYVGSPFQQNWGEAGEDKFVGIVDISDQGDIGVQWVPITGFPQYREVGLKEFLAECSADCEDRFRVVLKSPEEAAEFYAAKYSQRAEPQYDFDVHRQRAETSKTVQEAASAQAWSPESVMTRYVQNNPPGARGIQVPEGELLQVGSEIYAP